MRQDRRVGTHRRSHTGTDEPSQRARASPCHFSPKRAHGARRRPGGRQRAAPARPRALRAAEGARRPVRPGGARRALHGARAAGCGALPAAVRAARGRHAGGGTGPPQGDRPLRRRPRHRVLLLRGAHDARRGQAPLPRQVVDRPPAARPAGDDPARGAGDHAASTTLGRSPSVAELAEHLSVSDEDILDALEAGRARGATSLSAPRGDAEDGTTLGDLLGDEEDGFERAEERATLAVLFTERHPREQKVLTLRFREDMTQAEIGAIVGRLPDAGLPHHPRFHRAAAHGRSAPLLRNS